MRWRAELRQALPGVVWVCLVLAVAACGSFVVRNVTDALSAIAHHSDAVIATASPTR
jgi:hypothetical protein